MCVGNVHDHRFVAATTRSGLRPKRFAPCFGRVLIGDRGILLGCTGHYRQKNDSLAQRFLHLLDRLRLGDARPAPGGGIVRPHKTSFEFFDRDHIPMAFTRRVTPPGVTWPLERSSMSPTYGSSACFFPAQP